MKMMHICITLYAGFCHWESTRCTTWLKWFFSVRQHERSARRQMDFWRRWNGSDIQFARQGSSSTRYSHACPDFRCYQQEAHGQIFGCKFLILNTVKSFFLLGNPVKLEASLIRSFKGMVVVLNTPLCWEASFEALQSVHYYTMISKLPKEKSFDSN